MIKFYDKTWNSPLIASAGAMGFLEDKKYKKYMKLLGAITLKSLTLKPIIAKKGDEFSGSFYRFNKVGLVNPGIKRFSKEIYPQIEVTNGCKLIISLAISEETDDELMELMELVNELDKFSFIELNLSCPNKKNMLHIKDFYIAINKFRVISDYANKPIIVKLSSQIDPSHLLFFALDFNDDGAVAINIGNSLQGTINYKNKLVTGGLSGAITKPFNMRAINFIKKTKYLKIPIIATGGIREIADVNDYKKAGASLFGICSLIYGGYFSNLEEIYYKLKTIEV